MKRLLLFLFLSSVAFAQGVFVAPQTAFRTTNGITYPLANATITVCTANASGIPCAPVTVSIFSDAAETHPLSNPFQADSNGNYIFAVSAGTYTVTVTGAGFNGNSYQISVPAGAGTPIPAPSGGAATPGFTLPGKFYYTFADANSVADVAGGSVCFGTQALGPAPTATELSGRLFTSTASASGNGVDGCQKGLGANPNSGSITTGLLARASTRLMTQVTASVRYWVVWLDSSTANFGGSGFVTDTPNGNYCGFRHSDGTDVNWKAVCATSNVAQTVVDTGVATSTTASQLFEVSFTPAFAPTTALFYINGSQVASISTNVPAANTALGWGWLVDNKNTNTATSTLYMWSMEEFYK